MEKPLVSVVLCTFNGEKYLAAQLDSILGQTYSPLEIIISDDASTDTTRQVLQRYELDPRVRIFYQEKNSGLSENFGFASSRATGQLIAYSDQDDIWAEDKIEQLQQAIGGSPLIYSDSELVDENGISLGKRLSDIRNMYTGSDSRGYIFYSVVWGHGMMIKKELLQSAQPMPAGIHHDVWLAFKALTEGGIVYLDKVLTKYRQHTGSSSITLPVERKKRNKKEISRDYSNKLEWMKLMHRHERNAYKPFYEKLIQLYSKKEQGKYVWPLVRFLLLHRKPFFRFTRKSLMSNVVEILKHGRGVDGLTG